MRWSQTDAYTLADAVTGTLIVGATGSGKTSGSGAALARAFVQAGMGGLVLTCKDSDLSDWRRYLAEAGRSRDLLAFGPGRPWRFNLFDHAFGHGKRTGSDIESIVRLVMTALELADRGKGEGGGQDGADFFRRAALQMCRNIIGLLALSGERIDVPNMYQLVISAPTEKGQLKSDEWKASSFCFQCLKKALERRKTAREESDFEIISDYWLVEFLQQHPRTRSSVVATFTSLIDVLNRGLLKELFGGETNLTPQMIENGKVCVCDMPIKTHGDVALLGQGLMKFAMQRELEQRDIRSSPRPVFLWADEAQFFVTKMDLHHLATCRSSNIANVYLVQNVPSFIAALGGSMNAKAEADAIFGNLCTKIFHAQGDPVTCEWAASLAGRSLQTFYSGNSTSQQSDWASSLCGMGSGPSMSSGYQQHYELEIQPSELTKFRTGGKRHGYCVDGIVFQSGRVFRDTGKTWRHVTFRQKQ